MNSYAQEKDIGSIKVEARYRKDLGDIEGLAQSINEVGLLHPVVITADGRLIAGQRRLDGRQRALDLGPEPVGERAAGGAETLADLGGDGEPGRDRQPHAGHLGQVGTLAAEQVAVQLSVIPSRSWAEACPVVSGMVLFEPLSGSSSSSVQYSPSGPCSPTPTTVRAVWL